MTILSGSDNIGDKIFNEGNYSKITLGDGKNSIINDGSFITINAGDGNDDISNNSGENIFINAGNGNNTIANGAKNVSIFSGIDDDLIINHGQNTTINAGAGNDVIFLTSAQYGQAAKNTTVEGGSGNDTIYGNSNGENLYVYKVGDGDDFIYNFAETDSLSIYGADYEIVESDTDIAVKVEDNFIVIKDVDADNVIVIGEEIPKWTIDGTTAKFGTNKENLIVIEGLKEGVSADDFSLSGMVVTLKASALDKKEVTISDGYTLALADDVEKPVENAATWQITNGVATYKGSVTAGYSIIDNKIVYENERDGETLITVTGLKNDASISGLKVGGKIVTLSAAVLDKKEVTISDGYTLALADDVEQPIENAATWQIINGTATYKGSVTAGYSIVDNKIVYENERDGETLITVTGLKNDASISGLKVGGKIVTLSAAVLDKKEVTISDGYTLALADDVEQPIENAATWQIINGTATYKGSVTAGYSIVDNKIVYENERDGETLITVTGLKDDASISGLKVEGKVVTLSAAVLDKKEVTINDGYTLALADDVTKSVMTSAGWTLNGNRAIYNSENITEGYKLADGKIIYTDSIECKSPVTVIGATTADGQ